ncbi:MAG: hypothetical protein A2066_12130 [Bacteroidetes bacterium GWB2_41_8]|nr:MAG: hypothetical protein A2066_12130 [Bacteroidetes bacterium GWB2_41_8]
MIGGRVQGVGFRYFAQQKASELHICGWVKNTPDGRLELEAEGEPQKLATFIEWLKIGPTRAVVRTFSVSDISPARQFKNFTIR